MNEYIYDVMYCGSLTATFRQLKDAFIFIEGCDNTYNQDTQWAYEIIRRDSAVQSIDPHETVIGKRIDGGFYD